MDVARLLPDDPYMAAVIEAEQISDSMDSVCGSQGMDETSRACLSNAYYEALAAKEEAAAQLHPTTWVGRLYKLVEAKRSCHAGSEIAEIAPYLEGLFEELIRSMPQEFTRAWLKKAKDAYGRMSFTLGTDRFCCECLASVIASAAPPVIPSNDNGRLRSA